ncbi:uncharacterized protein PAC_18522 [Phialocephala subalpina]|uniref:Zn(2)-C6 fungal-type domain-containing protein n=1 Tax=Phialocephala subalpina TaxID=576137 RepID=A0A1L7XUD9_9HELO|nr:uncharacterized protein PAC_18522 [Phialocephala subalpina]
MDMDATVPILSNAGNAIPTIYPQPSDSQSNLTELCYPRAAKERERKRVSRACDYCKSKKIRCNGRQPCGHCMKMEIDCHYNAPYSRGRKITPPSSDPACRTGPAASMETIEEQPVPSRMQDECFALPVHEQPPVPPEILPAFHIISTVKSNGPSLRASPEPCERDMHGHFVGASSGVSFLIHLQRRLRSSVNSPPETSIFTFGDAALPEFDETSFILPPKEDAAGLVARYFEFASPTYRFLHRGTVEQWLEELYSNARRGGVTWRSKYAVLLIVFALASRYMLSSNMKGTNSGVEYFQAAERQLACETGSARLTSVQARLGECLYLLTCSRLNHCWSLFGTTARLIQALGLHRKSTKFDGDPSVPVNYVDAECKKRLFWCAYNLDKYLSAVLGRPGIFNDEDIDQELPLVVDDQNLSPSSRGFPNGGSYCMMIAPIAHIKQVTVQCLTQQFVYRSLANYCSCRLVRIMGRTLRELYGIKPLDDGTRYGLVQELGSQIEAWRRELPPFLNPDVIDPRLLIENFQRQSNMLSLAYGHAGILIYRPCLLNDSKMRTIISVTDVQGNVDKCLAAAMTIVNVLERMADARQLYQAFWFTYYQAFCAVVVFYTYTIRARSDDLSTWIDFFRAAERCQSLVSTVATEDSLAQRFCVIMEEFRLEVIRQIQHHSPSSAAFMTENSSSKQPDVAQSHLRPISMDGEPIWLGGLQGEEASHYTGDLPNWEQLDSLALDLGGIFPDLDL